MRPKTLLLLVVILAMTGGAGWYWFRAGSRPPITSSASTNMPPMAMTPGVTVAEPPAEVEISIPSSEVDRLHLKFAKVTEASIVVEIRVPGTVQPNAYKQIHVTPLVGGVVTQVAVEVGQPVKQGQPLAQIFSRDLAEAQTKYIADGAELEAEHKKLVRTQELARLGAASRQELEGIEASHQVHAAHVEESRQLLLLLGLNDQQVSGVAAGRRASPSVAIPAPFDGIVTARNVNLGQVVTASQDLLTITDLSSVWVEANLLEDNFTAVRIGSPATITTPAYPGRTFRSAVSYIDPQVDPQTRTAKVRIALDNPGLALRLGMYMDVMFTNATGRSTVAPKQALQSIGASSVVFVPVEGQPGKFLQRAVKTGEESPAGQRILEGLKPGETVVTDGSFLLRAEAIRQHP